MTDADMKILRDFLMLLNVPTDFKLIEKYDGMKFIIHPREQGHNKAHVHIQMSNGDEIEIGIDDGKVFNCSSKFPPKKIKSAVDFVKKNQDMFARNWNELTNGVEVSLA